MTGDPLVSPRRDRNMATGLSRSAAGVVRERRRAALRGNTRALVSGAFAIVSALPDVAAEVAIAYVLRPALDELADRRLVEQFALASYHYRRATDAAEREGLAAWSAFLARQAALCERLERELHARGKERAAASTLVDALAAYRPRPRAAS